MSKEHIFPFERAAKLHSDERQARQPYEPLVELIVSRGPDAVLDLGLGSGYFTLPLATALPHARIIGLDSEPRMLELTRQRAGELGLEQRLELAVTRGDGLDLPDATVDLVLMSQIYHEIADRPRHLAEVRRVLRPAGWLVISDWDRGEGDATAGPPEHHRVAKSDAEAELHRAGFEDITDHDLYSERGIYTVSAKSP